MRIIVCVKQVPDTQKVQVDPVTGVLIRNGIDTKMNPYGCGYVIKAFGEKEKLEKILKSSGIRINETRESR